MVLGGDMGDADHVVYSFWCMRLVPPAQQEGDMF